MLSPREHVILMGIPERPFLIGCCRSLAAWRRPLSALIGRSLRAIPGQRFANACHFGQGLYQATVFGLDSCKRPFGSEIGLP